VRRLTDKVPVQISRKLYNKIKNRVELSQGEFKNIEEYIEFVLSEVVKEEGEPEQVYTPQKEEEIKKRLRSLGYL